MTVFMAVAFSIAVPRGGDWLPDVAQQGATSQEPSFAVVATAALTLGFVLAALTHRLVRGIGAWVRASWRRGDAFGVPTFQEGSRS